MTAAALALTVFVATFALDAMWAAYIRAVSSRRAWSAALYSMGLVFAGAVATVSYVEEHWLVLPACLGALTGTLVSMRGGQPGE